MLNQTYPHFQLHVYDNASGDETHQIVAEVAKDDPRIKYNCQSENVGLVRNLAFGLGRVQTPLFNILSDDDSLLPKFFESAVRVMTDYPEAAMYIGATIDARTCGAVVDLPVHRYKRGLLRPPHGLLEVVKKGHSTWTGFMMKREVLSLGGGLDEQVGNICDVDLQLRITALYPVFVSRTSAAIFFSHPGQASGQAVGRIRDEVFLPWSRIVTRLVAFHTLSGRQGDLVKGILLGRLRRSVLHAGGEAAASGRYNEGIEAGQILKRELDSALPGLCVRGLCALAQVVPATATRFMAIVLEQI